MTLPARVVAAVRPQASAGVLAGAAVVAATFSATPLLLPDVAARLDVPLGVTGLLSTAQVGSFALASFLTGRLLQPRRRYHYGALALVAVATAISAIAPNLTILLASRVLAGLGMGTLIWIAWADATRFARGLGDIAAVGPVTAAIASPIIGWLVGAGGYPLVFGSLAGLALVATVFAVDFGELPRVGRNVSSSRSNRVLLGALLALSAGGSAVFIFSGAAAIDLYGMSTVGLAIAYSINAIAGVAATRFTAKSGKAGIWLAGTALAALTLGLFTWQPALWLILILWGFAFWMGVPAVFRLLADRSNHPAERVGDAQASMAMGRVLGPMLGGAALGIGSFGTLSVVGGSLMVVAAMIVTGVEINRSRPEIRVDR